MEVLGIHHVAVCVPDLDIALEFYEGKLEFLRLPRPSTIGPGAWLQVGSQQIHLICRDVDPLPAQHVALQVADLDAAIQDLESRGVSVRRLDPIRGGGRQAFFTDPCGNGIELNQPDE